MISKSVAAELMTPEVQDLVERLRGRGLRVTRQRVAVVRALCGAAERLTHQGLLEEARPWCPDLGLATVYRTVELLEACGCVRRVTETEGPDSLALTVAAHGHHVLCVKCNRVAEFSTCELSETIAGATRETGFVVTGHRLELLGLCGRCADKE